MRCRVDTRYGYASFDESEEHKARALYEREGLRLRRMADIFDDVGEYIAGVPIGVRLPVASPVRA